MSVGLVLAAVAGVTAVTLGEEQSSAGLWARLETEEVEPGVVRILHDGVRDLSGAGVELPTTYGEYSVTHLSRGIVAGMDGSVRILERDGHFELGEESVQEWTHPRRYHGGGDIVRVAPNGTLWRVAPGYRMRSFVDDRSRARRQGEWHLSLGISPSGRIWATAFDGCGDPEGCHPTRVLRRAKDGWRIIDAPRLHMSSHRAFAVGGSGEAWLCCRRDPNKGDPGLLRFDGRRWRVEDSPHDGPSDIRLLIDSAGRRTLWVRRSSSVLERYARGRWTTYDAEDGVPPIGYVGGRELLQAAPDGGVWVTPSISTDSPDDELKCDGVAHFDGETTTRFLRDFCIFSMDIAPDGTLWLQAAKADISNISLYTLNTVEPVQTFAITAFSAR